MTRQKKELIKKINQISEWIDADMALGCGFVPKDALVKMYEQIDELEEQLAKLCHYDNVFEMRMDDRWMKAHC